MKPYYADNFVTLYHGDCLDVTEWLSADVLVTDPPYGIDGYLSSSYKGRKPSGGFRRTHEKPTWDTTLADRNQVIRAWGDRPAAVFGTATRLDDVPPFRELPLVWDKGMVGMGDVTFPWGRGYELIYVSGEGRAGKRESPVVRVQYGPTFATRYGHPTPKPVELIEYLLRKAPPGVVADPFAGAGSTLVAAKALGRRSIGVEVEERYCEVAARRLSQEVLGFGGDAAWHESA